MRYGEYYFILPNSWYYDNEPAVKRMGADTTWQSLPELYPGSVEEPIGEGASTERIWFSRRLDQLNVVAHNDTNATNIIKYNGSSGLLGFDGGGPFVDWPWNAQTGYFKRAWSTRCDDSPGFDGEDGRPVSSASDNIRICRDFLGIERFKFPWPESYDTGKETRDPCSGLGLLALMEACGRLVGWKDGIGYFSDQGGFSGEALSHSEVYVRIEALCPFEEEHRDSWELHDVTDRTPRSPDDPSHWDKMYLLAWKEFVIPPREQWPTGFMNFTTDARSLEVHQWPKD